MPVVNVLTGGLTATSVRCRVKVDPPDAIVDWVVFDPETRTTLHSINDVTPDALGMLALEMTGLSPDTSYEHGFFVNSVFDDSKETGFRTPGPLGEPFSFYSAVSSCAAGSNRPGVGDVLASSRISNHHVFGDIHASSPLFFQHTGDFHYYDLGSGDHGIVGGASLDNYRRAYDDVLLQPFQDFLYRGTCFNYVWDDHDYGPNNADGTFASKANPAQVYRERVPHYDLAEASAIYHSFQIGRVLHIALDERFYRSPNDDPDDASKTMLGSAQKTWMENLLTTNADGAEFLIVYSSVQWLGGGADGWRNYSTERDELRDMWRTLGWEDRMLLVGGNNHRIGMDSGAGNEERTGAQFPVYMMGSLDSVAEGNENPPTFEYDLGPSSFASEHWGTIDIRDRGFAIEVTVIGHVGSGAWRVHRFQVPTTTGFVAP